MTATVKTWASLPVSAATDAALRVAAWRLLEPQAACLDPKCRCGAPRFLPDRNRDDLARVFEVAAKKLGCGAGIWPAVTFNDAWGDAINNPRAALCALLDLLSIPALPELEK